MKCSYNEAKTTMMRAAMGGGFSVGVAEDVGRAGAWLAGCGYSGGRAVLAAIEQYEGGKLILPPSWIGGEAALDDGHVAFFGMAILECLGANLFQQVRLSTSAPLLLIGFAGLVAKDYGQQTRFVFEGGDEVDVLAGGIEGNLNIDRCSGSVTITPITREEKNNILGTAVDMEEDTWHKLECWAGRCCASAGQTTDAGAGLLDND